MEILKFENSAPAPRKSARKKSNLKSLAGLATVAAIAVLGSTLAANISLGSGTLEFGQGVQVTAACDNSIILTPKVSFTNTSGGGTFYLSTIGFSDVSATGCAGKTLSLSAYGDTSATPLQIATVGSSALTVATVGILNGSNPTVAAGTALGTVTGNGTTTEAFDLGLTIPSATSGAVYKLTLQSN